METVTLKLARVGNSVGAIFPADIVKEQHLKPGEELVVTIQKKSNVLKELFGALPSKKSAETVLKEYRKEFRESKWL
mgnify:CR=1 FL=1